MRRILISVLCSIAPFASNAYTASIAAGGDHSLFVKNDGSAWACGRNSDGQLGDGTTTVRKLPVRVMDGVTTVAAGEYHSMFLKADGTAWTSGFNWSGQLGDGSASSRSTPVQVMSGVKAIAAGGSTSLFLKTDGTAWKTNATTHLPEQVLAGVAAIACGAGHSIFLKSDGTAWTSGGNTKGQLGDGTYSSRTSPLQVMSGVKAIGAGWQHSLFLKTDGSVWACGIHYADPGADGIRGGTPVPWPVASGIASIADGWYHSILVKTDGAALTVGFNGLGQLGDGTSTTRSSPAQVLAGVASVAGGEHHSLFLKGDGSVWACGDNGYYQLGDGTATRRFTPIPIFNVGGPVTPAAPGITSQPASLTRAIGQAATFTVVATGAAPLSYQWYRNGAALTGASASALTFSSVRNTDAANYTVTVSNSLGSVTSSTAILTIGTAPAPTTATVSAGAAHSLFLRPNGTAWMSGEHLATMRSQPVQVLSGVRAIASGWTFSLLLKSDGTAWGLGNPGAGWFGDGSTSNKANPAQIFTGVQAIAAGYAHAAYLRTDGTAWTAGDNSNGQLGDGTVENRTALVQVMTGVQAIDAGVFHTLFLKNDGSAWAVGLNHGNFLNSPWGFVATPIQIATSVTAIAAGGEHSLFLKSDGTAWAVGSNTYGQLGDGTNTTRAAPVQVMSGVSAISAGFRHSLFLRSDGTIWACGWNTYGQLGDGTTQDRSTPVLVMTSGAGLSAGMAVTYIPAGSHSLFVKSNGSVWACGANGWGQLGDGTTTTRTTPVQIFSASVGTITFAVQPVSTSTVLGASAAFSIEASGDPTPTFAWQRTAAGSEQWEDLADGTTYTGSRTATLGIASATSAMNQDQYRCLVSNTTGSLASDPAVLTVDSTPADAGFANLVAGVSAIVSPGSPGPIASTDLEAPLTTIVAGNKATPTSAPTSMFVGARAFNAGRVIAFGHDGLFNTAPQLDNARFIRNTIAWLRRARPGSVIYSTGHGEVAPQALGSLNTILAPDGIALTAAPGLLTAAQLGSTSVLIVGIATRDFTATEITAIRDFVDSGGGLLLIGLGWSWEPYNPGRTLADYPMNVLGRTFGVRWTNGSINNSTDQLDGSPVFRDFFPTAPAFPAQPSFDIAGGLAELRNLHTTYGDSLPGILESDNLIYARYASALTDPIALALARPAGHADREQLFNGMISLAQDFPAYFRRVRVFLTPGEVRAAIRREQFWRATSILLPLDAATKTTVADAAGLSGKRRTIWESWGIFLMDNARLNERQLEVTENMLTLIPPNLHDTRTISVQDYIGSVGHPDAGALYPGSAWGVNVFGWSVGSQVGPNFPSGFSPIVSEGFAIVLAHEINHIVDATSVAAVPAIRDRKAALISRAGSEPLNYLRSMFEPGFFVANPQEFVASIANQWFSDSATTVELGVQRSLAGRSEPINQALFFAELYSRGGNETRYYQTDALGNVTMTPVIFARDSAGRIESLKARERSYSFLYSAEGWVTSVLPAPTITAHPRSATALLGAALALEIQATDTGPLTYQWSRNGTQIAGANAAKLQIATATTADGGAYTVVVSNGQGRATSLPATVSIITPIAPLIELQPVSQAPTAGAALTLTASATGGTGLLYQWRLNGVDIAGATAASFVISSAQSFHSGSYTVVIRNLEGGESVSAPATVTITPAPASDARLMNLSTRALAQSGDGILIPGFVISGSGSKRVLIRGIGPTLGSFGVGDTLADPVMTVKAGNTTVASNDDWGTNANKAEIISTSATVGAFGLLEGSKDAALLLDLSAGAYTVPTSGAANGTGIGMVELYDADAGSPGARLVNISNRGFVGVGDAVMIPGIVVSNEGSRTFLIRAVGPTLAGFGVGGTLADPVLTVFKGNAAILSNDNWDGIAGSSTTASVAATVGAFPLATGSADAAFVVTLPPGPYTVQATGKAGTTGIALVEVYLVP